MSESNDALGWRLRELLCLVGRDLQGLSDGGEVGAEAAIYASYYRGERGETGGLEICVLCL
jgi:hypothetical protein